MTHTYVRHFSFVCRASDPVALRTRVATAHSYLCVRHDILMCATWLVHMCHMTHSYVVPQILLLFALVWLRLIPTHVCDMTHSYVQYDLFYVRHDSSGCLALDLFAFRASVNTTFPLAWHDWFTSVTWLIHMCDKRVWSNQYPASSTHWQMSLKLFVVRVSFVTKESEAINVLHHWLIDKWVLKYVSSVCRSWQKSLKQSMSCIIDSLTNES